MLKHLAWHTRSYYFLAKYLGWNSTWCQQYVLTVLNLENNHEKRVFVWVRFLFISFKHFLLHWSQDLLFGFDLKILDIQHTWQSLYEHIQFEHIHMKDYTYYINIHHWTFSLTDQLILLLIPFTQSEQYTL